MKAKVILSIVCLLTGAGLASWLVPPKEVVRVETRTEIVEVEVQTGTRETTRTQSPDGTVVETEKETFRIETDRLATDSTNIEIEKPRQNDWHVSIRSDFHDEYGVTIERRILGNIHVGGFVNGNLNKQTYGLSLGFSF